MTSRRMALEIRDAATGRCYGRRLVQLGFDDEMKDTKVMRLASGALWKDAKRGVDGEQPPQKSEQ